MADESLLKHVKLVDVVSEEAPWHGRPAAWKVTIAYQPGEQPALMTTFYLPKAETDEAGIIPLARNYFHRLTTKLGEDSKAWQLSDEQINELKIEKPKG